METTSLRGIYSGRRHCSRSRLQESRVRRAADSSNPTQLDRLSRRKRVPTLAYLSVCVAKESQESRKRVPV